jgi:hypothetical protein
MLDAGTLQTFVGAAVPLEKAEEAYADGHFKSGPGKVVVVVSD